mmetsp:Transcript_46114/g.142046  ORF Transcript_46114/g.142046 Transcript_46114/m.142046 type:complete len:155 (-) Transcript_46114:332-796(-)
MSQSPPPRRTPPSSVPPLADNEAWQAFMKQQRREHTGQGGERLKQPNFNQGQSIARPRAVGVEETAEASGRENNGRPAQRSGAGMDGAHRPSEVDASIERAAMSSNDPQSASGYSNVASGAATSPIIPPATDTHPSFRPHGGTIPPRGPGRRLA